MFNYTTSCELTLTLFLFFPSLFASTRTIMWANDTNLPWRKLIEFLMISVVVNLIKLKIFHEVQVTLSSAVFNQGLQLKKRFLKKGFLQSLNLSVFRHSLSLIIQQNSQHLNCNLDVMINALSILKLQLLYALMRS